MRRPNLISHPAFFCFSSSSPASSPSILARTAYPPPIHSTLVARRPAIRLAAFVHQALGSYRIASSVRYAPFMPTFMNGPHANSM